MSKFNKLPTDNSKTGPKEGSIFYRPQSTIRDQYKHERIAQQEKQQRLLSNMKAPNQNNSNNSRRRTLLRPVSRIAIGGNRGNHNKRTNALNTNKPDNHSGNILLRNYKKQYSRSQFETFNKAELPADTIKCQIYKKSLGCNRAYVGHFIGSRGPRFAKSRITAIREDDLQTQLERIQYDRSIHAKKKEELIAKCMYNISIILALKTQKHKNTKYSEVWVR